MSHESDHDEFLSNPLPCSLCYANLNFPLLRIFDHPIIQELPVCVCCEKELSGTLNSGRCLGTNCDIDMCSICLTDTNKCEDEVFICSSESCKSEYCRPCLHEIFGEDFIEKLNSADTWLCLRCDTTIVHSILSSKTEAKQNSIYSKVKTMTFEDVESYINTCEQSDIESTKEMMYDARRILYLHEQVDDEITRINFDILDEAPLQQTRERILEELNGDHEKTEEEISVYLEEYQKHLDMLHDQLAELESSSDAIGVFDIHEVIKKRQDDKWISEDIRLKESLITDNFKIAHKIDQSTEVPLLSSNNCDELETKFIKCKWQECEGEVDPVLKKYAGGNDLDYDLFPSLFRDQVSPLLLKALYSAGKEDFNYLMQKYKIPPQISIIMKYAKKNNFSYDIEFSRHFPSMLVKALRATEDVAEQDFLIKFYNVKGGSDTDDLDHGVEDILDENDYLEINENLARSKDYYEQVEAQDFKDWLEKENKVFDQQRESLSVSGNHLSKMRFKVAQTRKIKRTLDDSDECDERNAILRKIFDDSMNPSKSNQKRESVCTARLVKAAKIGENVNRRVENLVKPPLSDIDKNVITAIYNDESIENTKKYDVHDNVVDLGRRECGYNCGGMESDISSYDDSDREDDEFLRREKDFEAEAISQGLISEPLSNPNSFKGIEIIELLSDSGSENGDEDLRTQKKSPTNSTMKLHPIFRSNPEKSNSNDIIAISTKTKAPKQTTNRLITSALQNTEEKRHQARKKSLHFYAVDKGDSEGESVINKLRDNEDPEVRITSSIFFLLKEHQLEAVRFMWSNVVGSIAGLQREYNEVQENARLPQTCAQSSISKTKSSSGCIIAHCMGLGKTLSVVAFTITLLTHPEVSVITDFNVTPFIKKQFFSKVLIVAPLNTIANWDQEYRRWTPSELWKMIQVVTIDSKIPMIERITRLRKWHEVGGICIMSYNLFTVFAETAESSKTDSVYNSSLIKMRYSTYASQIKSYLISPGPDILVVDEAHILKNSVSKTYRAISQVHTTKRVALTGSPLQNNLTEYFTMVNFVRPNFLGTNREFKERYRKPIEIGNRIDASYHDMRQMRLKTYRLHKKLEKIVDRKDNSVLVKELSKKREFVLVVKMTEVQKFLYSRCLNELSKIAGGQKVRLFCAFQELLRIWNHPANIVLSWLEIQREETAKKHKNGKCTSMRPMNPTLAIVWAQLKPILNSIAIDREETISHCPRSSNGYVINLYSSDEDDENDECVSRCSHESSLDKVASNNLDVTHSSSENIHSLTETPSLDAIKNNKVSDVECFDSDEDESFDKKSVLDPGWWRIADCPEMNSLPRVDTVGGSKFREICDLLDMGNKIKVLLSIIALSVNVNDKVLVFSQSITNLNFIELVLNSASWGRIVGVESSEILQKRGLLFSNWKKGYHYFRIDGSISDRQNLINTFNSNPSSKVFLISTKAGNMGINLQAANRVVLFDSSFNPVHDMQAIYRSYRYGQKKDVFVYRLLSRGSMEEKIYRTQVTKLQLAARVIDAHTPKATYTSEVLDKGHLSFTETDRKDYPKGDHGLGKDIGIDDKVLQKLLGNKSSEKLLSSVEDLDPLIADDQNLHLTVEEKREAEKEENDDELAQMGDARESGEGGVETSSTSTDRLFLVKE